MCLFYYCNFALGECKLYKGITNYIYNRYWGVQIPGSTYYMLHRYSSKARTKTKRNSYTCIMRIPTSDQHFKDKIVRIKLEILR